MTMINQCGEEIYMKDKLYVLERHSPELGYYLLTDGEVFQGHLRTLEEVRFVIDATRDTTLRGRLVPEEELLT